MENAPTISDPGEPLCSEVGKFNYTLSQLVVHLIAGSICNRAEGLLYIAKALRQDAYACKVPVSTAVLKHLIGFKPVAEGSSEYHVHWTKAQYHDEFLFALTRSLSKWHLLQSELYAAVMHRYPPAKVGLIDVDTYKREQGTLAAVNMLPCLALSQCKLLVFIAD